jgi:uncharacterized RmlC-like cupin family protein
VTEEIRIVPNGALESGPSTGGMTRKTAVAGDDIWMGEVRTEAGAMSGWHHHGEHTTYGYIIAGRARVEFGPGGGQSLEGASGDFFVVPPHTVHREGNPGSEEQVLVAIRLGNGPSVINVEGPSASGN